MESPPNKKKALARFVCLAITLAALAFVAGKIDFHQLAQTLWRARPVWFFSGAAIFGGACLIGAWRWHLVLRLVNISVHGGATTRLTFIGHFFYTIFFGVAGGDTARSALYVRWYRFPLPEILTTVSLDRLLALAGLCIFAAGAFVLGAWNGAFQKLLTFQITIPAGKMAAAGVFLAVLAVVAARWRPDENSFAGRVVRSFLTHARLLATSRRIGPSALLAGFLVQAILCSLLAINLRAVTTSQIPWAKLFWIFPVVFLFSSLPISVGGLGVREGAALAFLGLYGIPATEAVAASFLTFVTTMIWMALGGIIFLREENLFEKCAAREPPKTLSVVIPTLNESAALPETIAHLTKIPEILEIIVADGGSSDTTREIAARLGCRVLPSSPGRGTQMRAGAAQARGDVVILLHADTWLPPHAGRAVLHCLRDKTVVAGGFWKIFRHPHFLMRGSRWRCATRLYLFRRIAGDQAIFVRREVLEEIGGVPDVLLMEEFELCRRLRQIGRLALAGAVTETSARRFRDRGVWRTYALMGRVTARYFLGASPESLRRMYEEK